MKQPSSPENPSLVCAWCGKMLRYGAPSLMVSHGICPDCMGGWHDMPVEDLSGVESALFEGLPIGVVRLDAAGVILAFNRRESERFGSCSTDVIGRSFFEEVAPCTSVKEFRGSFGEMVQAKVSGHRELDFVFCHKNTNQRVRIVLIWNAAREIGHLLISAPQA
jgi:photoactive yellow protein